MSPQRLIQKAIQRRDFNERLRTIANKLTIPPRWTFGKVMNIPPRTPKRAIKIQLTAKSEVPDNNRPSFKSIMRMPNANPPLIPSIANPAKRADSKSPRIKPRKKNAMTMAVRSESEMPGGETVLINAAHAVEARRRVSAELPIQVQKDRTTHGRR